MVSMHLFLALVSFVTVHAISQLSIKGSKFFNAEGQQVYFKGMTDRGGGLICIVGVAYQRSPYDPFQNTTQCQLDAELMKTLGANAIRSTSLICESMLTRSSSLPCLIW